MKNYSFTDISPHKQQLKTARMNIPALFHLSEDLMPNGDTIKEIEDVAASPYPFHHLAIMSDVHSKKGRKNPTGTVVASKHYLLPQINDTAPNCGMRFLKTNLTDEDLEGGNLDKLFQKLVQVVPTKKYVGTVIPYQLVLDICRKGVEPVKKYFQTRTKNEIENNFQNGNFFQKEVSERDIRNVIPELFLYIGKYRLGILGAAGNHFLDLMKVTGIKNDEIAKKLGVATGQYIFLLHTGSGLMGQYASYFYTPKRKEHASQRLVLKLGQAMFRSDYRKQMKVLSKKIEESKHKDDFFAYDDRSLEGQMFINSHNASANHGFANRVILTHHIDRAIEEVLGKNPELDLLYDMPHVYIHRENHYGHDVWVHRNGTIRANGPSRMKDHSLFSSTGEPVFIPSSMSTSAYLGVGTDENESAFFSASHGTGRRKNPQIDTPENKNALLEKLSARKVKLYNAKSKGVIMQDSAYYKDVEEVIRGMEENKIVKVVAKMEPVAVLMY